MGITHYVDNVTFIFSDRNDIEKGLILIINHHSRFGLTVHYGNNNLKSKTEGIFSSKPRYDRISIEKNT